ncbi:ribonuclease P protein component [Psychrobacter aestuarii]|uniref:ribonuclease P protein component n=1 Tax=Psychrobacter aestuarii TaxID=556327 RepID=UPI001D119EE3|nr:ribonuclease P protein component [Psychrobacter aestuarii]
MEKNASISNTKSFVKAQRLLTPRAFKQVFDAPERKVHQAHLMAFVRTNELAHARLGMAITKRKVPTAVMRNKLKRHIREHFRNYTINLKNNDIVFIVKNQ